MPRDRGALIHYSVVKELRVLRDTPYEAPSSGLILLRGTPPHEALMPHRQCARDADADAVVIG
jgi:hypothetical protein